MARKRRHALYCTIVADGPLALVRLPDRGLALRPIIRKLAQRLKADHGTRAKDIYAIEGLAGSPPGEEEQDPAFLIRITQAFAGDTEILPRFDLYDWDEATESFFLIRGNSA